MECHEDALFLKPFVDSLKKININLDTIDTYCVYTRLKIFENTEIISVNYLEYELKNLENGNEITESNSTNANNFIGCSNMVWHEKPHPPTDCKW